MTRTGAVVVTALVLAVVVDLVAGVEVPGRFAAFGLVSSVALGLGSKWLGSTLLSRPVGSRPGDVDDDPGAAARPADTTAEDDRA